MHYLPLQIIARYGIEIRESVLPRMFPNIQYVYQKLCSTYNTIVTPEVREATEEHCY